MLSLDSKPLVAFASVFAAISVQCGTALEVNFAADLTSYHVQHGDSLIFSAADGVAVFCDGKWHNQLDHSLNLTGSQHVSGKDVGLGAYTGMELKWMAGHTPVVTTAKTYATGNDVAFQYTFPEGATGTSTMKFASTDRNEVIVNFPAFTKVVFPNTLSWEGSFVGAKTNQYSQGPPGGPTVFFDSANLSTVVVGSAMNNFKATSAGPGTTFKGTKAWVPGTPGTIVALPVGWTQTFLLHAGSTSGITAAIGEWGEVLQSVHGTAKSPDVTLQKIGYQTDNGAYYVFCRGNCSDTLLKKVSELKDMGVPMGYLSFQGGGASSLSSSEPNADHDAPWCVNTWGIDGGLGGQYPMPLPEFQKALNIPFQLYAPYFCPSSDYFNSSSNWTSVKSDTTVCPGYGFQDVTPEQSRLFYDWFFAKGQSTGMVSFEPDFMNQNYNCVPEFIESATNSTIWQHGMADAALAKNMTVQWCYATPTDVLASLTMPAVTNFRVSNDFCYGNSWNVGVSSLIVWAAGVAPSKDTLWSSSNGGFAVPGCPWTPDHEEPAAELHVVLALMTTGPVGISDGIGFTNGALLKRTIRSDGTLLKPSKPATSVDSSLAGSKNGPKGFVYATLSGAWPSPTAHYFVSFKMQQQWSLTAADFYPPLKAGTSYVYRRFQNGTGCVNGSAGSSCAVSTSIMHSTIYSDVGISIPKSNMQNTSGGTDFAPQITTVFPVCHSGWALLGDLTKYVAVSQIRFSKVVCSSTGISVTVLGTPGEVVPTTFLKPSGSDASEVLVVDAKILSSGSAHLDFGNHAAAISFV